MACSRFRIAWLGLLALMVIGHALPAHATTMTLTADRAAPQPVGTTIRWTTGASGGSAPYSYKWWLYDGSGWRLLRDWNTSTSFEWKPTAASSAYRLGVWVRSSGSNADTDEANASAYFAITTAASTTSAARVTAVTLAADRVAPQPAGTTITWTAQASGGVAPHSYKWWIHNGSTWQLLKDWSTSASYAWTPNTANSAYRAGVWVRSAGNTADVDESNQAAYFSIAAASAPKVTAVTLTPDRIAPQPAGTTVRWTASATGGSGPISYKWWVDDGLEWKMLADWSTTDAIAWTPARPNEAYRIGVWARSATSTADADESNMSQAFPVRGGVPDCLSSLEPAIATFGSGGGMASLRAIPAEPGCAWSATSQATWVTVTSAPAGAGEGSVGFVVAPNPDRVSRTGFIMVGAKAFSVTQGGTSSSSGCSYAVFPTVLDVGFGNESATVAVTAPAGCSWIATSAGFAHAAPGSGVGSSVITIAIENNTAPEPRAAVMTVAGRAITLTQAGRSANDEGCTYAVTPGEATVGFHASTGTITVVTSPGCPWTATTAGSFVRLTSATTGTGSGSVAYAVEANGTAGPRATLVTVQGKALTVTQGAAALVPSCAFALTASSASVSYAGGSGAVSVATTADCEWDVTSRTDWIHVIESSGPLGSGSVWYSVDANSGTPRAGTLVIAGQILTVSQGAPPADGGGDDITWVTPPDPERVGQCEGNCGAGCGTFFNPCGGPHYWERTVLSSPQYVGDDWEPVCSDSSSWYTVRPRYTALVRWTYHGLKSSMCAEHDATCRNLDLIPFLPVDKALCLATAGLVGLNGLNYCEGARPFDWSYDFVDVGHGAPVAFIDGGSSCN